MAKSTYKFTPPSSTEVPPSELPGGAPPSALFRTCPVQSGPNSLAFAEETGRLCAEYRKHWIHDNEPVLDPEALKRFVRKTLLKLSPSEIQALADYTGTRIGGCSSKEAVGRLLTSLQGDR